MRFFWFFCCFWDFCAFWLFFGTLLFFAIPTSLTDAIQSNSAARTPLAYAPAKDRLHRG